MGFPQSPEALEAQRQAALRSAAVTRQIVLRYRVASLRDLVRVAKEVRSPDERINYYRSILQKAKRELAAAEKA